MHKALLLLLLPIIAYTQVNEFRNLSLDIASDSIEKTRIKTRELQEYIVVETYEKVDKNKMVAYLTFASDAVYVWALYLDSDERVQRSETKVYASLFEVNSYKLMLAKFNSLRTRCKPIVRTKKGKIKVVNNQWAISKFVSENSIWRHDPIAIVFKHRFFQFRCLSPFRNIKQRKYVKSFFNDMQINVNYRPMD